MRDALAMNHRFEPVDGARGADLMSYSPAGNGRQGSLRMRGEA